MVAPRVYKADAIILKRRNTGETDRILTVYSKEYGKLRIIAKGVRKVTSRRGPHLEIFSRVILFVHRGKTLDSVSEVASTQTHENLRKDMQRVSLAYFFCELVDTLTPEKQEHADIFDALSSALGKLNDASNGQDIYLQSRQFTLELLWLLGFLPRHTSLAGEKLQAFIETITERKLRTPHFARQVAH